MKRDTAAWLSLSLCFVAVCLLMTPTLSTESIALPMVLQDQGFTVTITYYYVSGPRNIVLVGSIQSPETVTLKALTGTAFIAGHAVGSGVVDESPLHLTGGIAAPVSATVTTYFNIYNALWLGAIVLPDHTVIPFRYDSTPITVTLSGQLCAEPVAAYCFSWPSYNQTSLLPLL